MAQLRVRERNVLLRRASILGYPCCMAYEVMNTCLLVPGITVSACASWVQAWGSIAAIFAAVWIGNRQLQTSRRLEAETRHRADLLKLEVLYSLFADARGQVGLLEDATERGAEVARPLQRLSEIREALMALPVFESPTRLMCFATLEGPRAIFDLDQAVRQVRDALSSDQGVGSVLLPEEVSREFRRAIGHARGVFSAAEGNSKRQTEYLRTLLPPDRHLHPEWLLAENEESQWVHGSRGAQTPS